MEIFNYWAASVPDTGNDLADNRALRDAITDAFPSVKAAIVAVQEAEALEERHDRFSSDKLTPAVELTALTHQLEAARQVRRATVATVIERGIRRRIGQFLDLDAGWSELAVVEFIAKVGDLPSPKQSPPTGVGICHGCSRVFQTSRRASNCGCDRSPHNRPPLRVLVGSDGYTITGPRGRVWTHVRRCAAPGCDNVFDARSAAKITCSPACSQRLLRAGGAEDHVEPASPWPVLNWMIDSGQLQAAISSGVLTKIAALSERDLAALAKDPQQLSEFLGDLGCPRGRCTSHRRA